MHLSGLGFFNINNDFLCQVIFSIVYTLCKIGNYIFFPLDVCHNRFILAFDILNERW